MNSSLTGSTYNSHDNESQKKGDSNGYKGIKDSIDKITKGLQSKENINMKQIIN
jgi:hypothetical protein